MTGPRTRFAPAPTGMLHLGHLVNAAFVWGAARALGGRVVLRIEDHDRQRSRAAWESALLEDLERLGLVPDEPSIAALRAGPSAYRQSDGAERYAAALEPLRARGLAYACTCSRGAFGAWAARAGRPWSGPGCPGGCAARDLWTAPGTGIRVVLGDGHESWEDLLLGRRGGEPSAAGDPLVRDRLGNWTYLWCVVVDDLASDIGLVVRGADLVEATPAQLRLARSLTGEPHPARFLHHPLIERPDGSKLSKSDGASAIRARLDAGARPHGLIAEALRAAGFSGIPDSVEVGALGAIIGSLVDLHRPAT